jgi:hypothetical protein
MCGGYDLKVPILCNTVDLTGMQAKVLNRYCLGTGINPLIIRLSFS